MPKVKDIYNFIDSIAPYNLQESYDNSGMNVMFGDKDITKALIALDITTEVVEEAAKKGADLIITHHPVIFGSVTSLRGTDAVVKLCQKQISALSAHTNFDNSIMNDILCEELGMTPIAPLCSDGDKNSLADNYRTALFYHISCGIVAVKGVSLDADEHSTCGHFFSCVAGYVCYFGVFQSGLCQTLYQII